MSLAVPSVGVTETSGTIFQAFSYQYVFVQSTTIQITFTTKAKDVNSTTSNVY